MDNLAGNGVQEFSWTASSPRTYRGSLSFAERNVHHLRSDVGSGTDWFSRGFARAYSIEGFTLIHAAASQPATANWCNPEVRDWDDIAYDRRDRFALMVQISGDRKITQMGRTKLVSAGHAAFFCTSEPYMMESRTLSDRSEMIALYIPGEYVNRRLVNPKRLCVRTQSSALDRLTLETVRLFAAEAWGYGKSDFFHSAKIISNLILETQEHAIDERYLASSARAITVARVKSVIRRRLAEIDLTLGDVADEVGLSLGYLHKLFRQEGITLANFIKAERLSAAREMLKIAPSRKMSVTEVSLNCGFSDSSYFSRIFKATFGMTPREATYRG